MEEDVFKYNKTNSLIRILNYILKLKTNIYLFNCKIKNENNSFYVFSIYFHFFFYFTYFYLKLIWFYSFLPVARRALAKLLKEANKPKKPAKS